MAQLANDIPQSESRRDQWVARVEAFVNQIIEWAAEENWAVDKNSKTIHERVIGQYVVPTLRVRLPLGEIHVNPVGLHVVGADGRVDIEAFPTLNRVKLIGVNNQWEVYTDSNVPLRQPWTRKTFTQLAQDLLA